MGFSLTSRFQRLAAVALIAPVLAACGDSRTFDTVSDCANSKRYTQTQCQNAFNRASGLPVEEDWAPSSPEENPVVLSAAQLQAAKEHRAQMAREAAAAAAAIAGALLDAAAEAEQEEYEQYERQRPQPTPRHSEPRTSVPETKSPAPAPQPQSRGEDRKPSIQIPVPQHQETERYQPPRH